MLSLSRFQCYFSANWRLGVLALLLCLFFVRLGFWQLERADEKQQMLTAQSRLSKETPTQWRPGATAPLQYQPIQVHGYFLKMALLLDNQHYQHQFGYHVLSPFVLESGDIKHRQVILIDRGWVPGDLNRKIMPAVNTPSGIMDVVGSAYFPSKGSWSLGGVFDKKQPNMAVIESIDSRVLSQFLHKSVYPFIIRMRAQEPDGFIRDWPVVAISPDRHRAYAVQWFAMALVILILFITLNVKKKT